MGKTRFILPNAFTSMNFLLGVFAICWVTGAFSSFTSSDPIRMGAYFIILCALLDKLDGFAARLVHASSEFGAQFDSLADLIAFGVAPAFTVFFTYKTVAPESWFQTNAVLLIVVFAIYVLCAAMRLAKYNACDSDTYHHHFSGLPSTFAGAINAVLVVYLKSKGVFTADSALIYVPLFVMLITGLLMVSPLFLPKLQPRKNAAFNTFQAVMIVITYICGFTFVSEGIPFVTEYILLLMASYIVIGFGVGIAKRKEIIAEAEAEAAQKK